MDVGDVAAALAVLVAVWAAVVAHRANGRARDANILQKRIDDRVREFRDVEWKLDFAAAESGDSPLALALTNIGSSKACGASVVVTIHGRRRLLPAGDVGPGETASVVIPDVPEGVSGPTAESVFRDLGAFGYLIHWSSPLGAPDQYRNVGRQLF